MKQNIFPPTGWLPAGKRCAVLFSIDDVHPATAQHGADAGGDLGQGVLGYLEQLIARHPQLWTSLCTTPDWRSRVPYPTRRVLARLGPLANRLYLAPRWPAGTFALDRHPEFVAYLRSLPRTEVVPHGLHHIRKGQPMPIEFGRASESSCTAALTKIDGIMARAGIAAARGLSPPGWEAPPPLRRAMRHHGLEFVASARDVQSPIAHESVTAMSGMTGQPLIYPGITDEGLIHIPTNFQATSPIERALAILECGGLLSVKAHAIKRIGTYVALDGLDEDYVATLDNLFEAVRVRFGEAIWWTSMGKIAAQTRAAMIGEAAA